MHDLDGGQQRKPPGKWAPLVVAGSVLVGSIGAAVQWSTLLHDNPPDVVTRLNAIEFAELYFRTAARDPGLAWNTMVTEEFRRTSKFESTGAVQGYRDFWLTQSGVTELDLRGVDQTPGAFKATFRFRSATGKIAKRPTTIILSLVCDRSAWSFWPGSECAPERIKINTSDRPDSPTPTPPPPSTASPPPSPTPSVTSADPLKRANVGVMPDGFTLPGARPPYESMDKLWACAFKSTRFTTLADREASRVALAQGTVPGSFTAIGAIVFGSENQAASFMLELAKEAVNCPDPKPVKEGQWHQTFEAPKGSWSTALYSGYSLTPLPASSGKPPTGAALFLAAMRGRAVAFYAWNGSSQQHPTATKSDPNYSGASREIVAVLDQLR